MATPHVAGAFAALMGVGATAAEAESFLKSTAVDLGAAGVDILYGHGESQFKMPLMPTMKRKRDPKELDTPGWRSHHFRGHAQSRNGDRLSWRVD